MKSLNSEEIIENKESLKQLKEWVQITIAEEDLNDYVLQEAIKFIEEIQ